MASDTEIANMALGHIGFGVSIASLETEQSIEAKACRRFYENNRKTVLRDFEWPCATKFVTLSLVEETPTTEWAYSYRYPPDCLKFRRILGSLRNPGSDQRIPYRIAADDSGKLIYTDQELAESEYTFNLENPERFDEDMALAMSFRLAALITPTLSKGDPFKRGDAAMKAYEMAINNARGNSLAEEQPEQYPDAESIRARE